MIAQLIPLAINVSMGLIVLAIGLRTSLPDVTWLLNRPGLLLRSLVSMNVIMPLVAIALVLSLDLQPAVKIAIVALALSPVPPILPGKQFKIGGNTPYVIGLLVFVAACAIVIAPGGIALLSRVFNLSNNVPLAAIARVVLISVILPVAIGVAVHQYAPAFAERISHGVSIAGSILLVVAFVPVLFVSWDLITSMIGNGTLLTLAVFSIIGVAVGHWLGGPDADDRGVLALATATRHPGVALAIASATFPEQKAVLAAVLWHLIVAALVTIPYVKWRQQAHALAHPVKPHGHPNARHAGK